MHTEFAKKKVFKQLTLAAVSSTRRRHGRQKVSIPECNLTGRLEERSTITLFPVRPKNKTTVNLKSAFFFEIILLHKGLTHIHSQIKPWLRFDESFTCCVLYWIIIWKTNEQIVYVHNRCHVMSLSVTAYPFPWGCGVLLLEPIPALRARAGCSLDKSPAHRRASLMSNVGFSISLKDTSTCSPALPRARI